MGTMKKITIGLTEELYAELQQRADEMGKVSVTELIRHAVSLQKFVWEHRDAELLIREGGEISKIVLL